MGLASGKSKLKLIDIDSNEAKAGARLRHGTALGGKTADHGATGHVPATEVGAILRNARERSDQSLRDASRNLRIRMEYLGALEEGDFKALPGMTYAVGYVRTYAQYLGLDVERAITLFKAEASDLTGPRQLVFPSPAPEGKVPGGALMFVAALLAIAGYVGWYQITDSGRAIAGYSLEVPEVLQSWLDEPSTGTSSDGFTSAAIAASPSASSTDTATTQRSDDAVEAPHTLVPLSETSVVGVAPTVTSEIRPRVAPRIASDSTAEVAARITAATNQTPEASSSSATATASITSEDAPAQSTSEEVQTSLASTISAVSPAPIAATTDSPPQHTTPIVVASLPIADGGEFSGLSSDAGPITARDEAATPPAVAVVAPAETRPASLQSSTTQPAISESATPSAPGTLIPRAPDMTRSAPAASQPSTSKLADAKRARVVIKASAASWVQVRASDSTTIMTKVMRAGDVYEVPDKSGLRLFTGNAGALTILVDGKAIPGIGGSGEVARNIDLAPEILEKQVN